MTTAGPTPSLTSMREAAARVFSRHPEVDLALLFGSAARGTQRDESDLDFAVHAGAQADLPALAVELGALFGREIDILPLAQDPGVPMLEALIADSQVIYERSPGGAAGWRSRTLISLETDRPWFARMRDAWLKRVATRGL